MHLVCTRFHIDDRNGIGKKHFFRSEKRADVYLDREFLYKTTRSIHNHTSCSHQASISFVCFGYSLIFLLLLSKNENRSNFAE